MIPGNLMTPSRSFLLDPFGIFSPINRVLEEPLSLPRPKLPMEENYWPMRPWTPACDIFETDKEIVLKFELPEVKKENVKVVTENHVLSVTGERKFEEETDRENYHRVERHYGEFTRSFTVPVTVDTTKISAEFKEGVLTVALPKREEAKAKQIDVKIN